MDSTKEYSLIARKWWGLLFIVKLFGREGHWYPLDEFFEFTRIIWYMHDINAEFEKLCIYITADV